MPILERSSHGLPDARRSGHAPGQTFRLRSAAARQDGWTAALAGVALPARKTMLDWAMDTQALTRRLEEVERHIRTGQRLIANARKKLARAAELELDPAEGEQVIQTLEAVQ